jgi:hypothetical protein
MTPTVTVNVVFTPSGDALNDTIAVANGLLNLPLEIY